MLAHRLLQDQALLQCPAQDQDLLEALLLFLEPDRLLLPLNQVLLQHQDLGQVLLRLLTDLSLIPQEDLRHRQVGLDLPCLVLGPVCLPLLDPEADRLVEVPLPEDLERLPLVLEDLARLQEDLLCLVQGLLCLVQDLLRLEANLNLLQEDLALLQVDPVLQILDLLCPVEDLLCLVEDPAPLPVVGEDLDLLYLAEDLVLLEEEDLALLADEADLQCLVEDLAPLQAVEEDLDRLYLVVDQMLLQAEEEDQDRLFLAEDLALLVLNLVHQLADRLSLAVDLQCLVEDLRRLEDLACRLQMENRTSNGLKTLWLGSNSRCKKLLLKGTTRNAWNIVNQWPLLVN